MVKLLLVALACWLPLLTAIDLHAVPSTLAELDSRSMGDDKKKAEPAKKDDAKKDDKKEEAKEEPKKEEKKEDPADAKKGAAGGRLAKIEDSLKKLTTAVAPKVAGGDKADMSNWEPAKIIKKEGGGGGGDAKLLKEIKQLTKDQPESALGKPPKMPGGDISWMTSMKDVLEYPCKGGNMDECEKKAAKAKAAKGKGAKGDPAKDAENYNKIKEILGEGGKGEEAKGEEGKGEEAKGEEAKGEEAKGEEAKGEGKAEAKGEGKAEAKGEGKAEEAKHPTLEKIKEIVKGDSLLDNDDDEDDDDDE